MKRDELLDDLGRLARAQEAQATAGEVDAEALLRQFDAEAYARIAARVLPLVQPEPQATEAATVTGPPASSRATPRRARSRSWIIAVPALAAAVAGVLWFVWPRGDASLPVYALELRGGPSADRGTAAAAVLHVGPEDNVSAVLRPATAVSGALAVRVFVDGRALPEAPALVVEQSPAGAVRISGLGPALAALTPGRHRLQFAVGRPESVNTLADALPPSGVARGVQLLGYEIECLSR